jgi:hypothetical protein
MMMAMMTAAGEIARTKNLSVNPLATEITARAEQAIAANRVAAVFNLPEELPQLDDGVAQFYGAVGGTLCSTLWDPGSSVNLITPEFAKELSERGVRWEYCEPCHIEHGSGESGGVRSYFMYTKGLSPMSFSLASSYKSSSA